MTRLQGPVERLQGPVEKKGPRRCCWRAGNGPIWVGAFTLDEWRQMALLRTQIEGTLAGYALMRPHAGQSARLDRAEQSARDVLVMLGALDWPTLDELDRIERALQ